MEPVKAEQFGSQQEEKKNCSTKDCPHGSVIAIKTGEVYCMECYLTYFEINGRRKPQKAQ